MISPASRILAVISDERSNILRSIIPGSVEMLDLLMLKILDILRL